MWLGLGTGRRCALAGGLRTTGHVHAGNAFSHRFTLMTTDSGPKRGYKHSDITEKAIGPAYTVYSALGHGFLEKVYENALAIELGKQGVGVKQQEPVLVRYDGLVVGEYVADMVVDGKVIVEVKAQGSLDGAHEAQLINYLKATGIEVGLLINFGPRIGIKRRVFDRQ